jgi:L-rhamnose mutarotase
MTQERRQYCLTLELRNDENLIREYEEFHRPGGVWPEVLESIRKSGILDMQIYRRGTLLTMVLTVSDAFSFDEKAEQDSGNPKVVEWERLMTRFQRADAGAGAGDKWQLVSTIFNLREHR